MRKRKQKIKNNTWENLNGFRYAHRGLFHQPRSASRKPTLAEMASGFLSDERIQGVKAWKAAGKLLIPENSYAAFRRAVRCGFGAELDVHLTADGNLVVFHDDSLLRMCGVEGSLEEMTMEEVSKLRLLGTHYRIPEFSRVLDLFTSEMAETDRIDTRPAVRDKAKLAGQGSQDEQTIRADRKDAAPRLHLPLIIELKCVGNTGPLCSAVMEMIDRYPSLNYCVESFDPRVVLWLKRHRPEVVRGQLTENFMKSKEAVRTWGHLMTLGMWCVAPNALTRPDFIACKFVDRRNIIIRLCHRLGVRQVSWTIANQKDMNRVDREGGLSIFERFYPKDMAAHAEDRTGRKSEKTGRKPDRTGNKDKIRMKKHV